MRSISSLIHKLKTDYPDIAFVKGDTFSWSPVTKSVFYNAEVPHAAEQLLHEISHGILGHTSYRRDIELLSIESAAWDKAKELAQEYRFSLSEDIAEDNLDTYREWLHSRSTCPNCTANGYQTSKTGYQCPACSHAWTVNEARVCALRRRSAKARM